MELRWTPAYRSSVVALGLTAAFVAVIDMPLDVTGRAIGMLVWAAASVLAATAIAGQSRRLSVAAAIVGACLLSVLVGYTGARVIGGDSVAAAIGTGATLAWAALTVLLAWRVLRESRWPGRIAIAFVAVAFLQFGGLPLAAGTAGAHAPRVRLVSSAPDGSQLVTITTSAGADLRGWYTPGRTGAAVVVLPGAGGNREQTRGHAAVLSRRGFAVLAIDARGSGDSGGFGNLWGWTGTTDISASVAWLRARPELDDERIALLGLSMGGEQALTAVADGVSVAAVVGEGVEARVPDDTWYIGGDIRAEIERTAGSLAWIVADAWTAGPAPRGLRDVATRLGATPVLVVAADTPTERAVSADLAARAPSVEVWQLVGIGHTEGLTAAPAEWEARVVDFLTDRLGR